MKLNDFYATKTRVIKTSAPLILSNERKEKQLTTQVEELKNELLHLQDIDTLNHDLNQRASKFNSKEQTMRQEIVSLQNEKHLATSEIERLLAFQRANQDLNVQVKNLNMEIDNSKGVFELAKTNNLENNKNLLALQQRFDVLFNEEAGMRSELNQAQNKLKNQGVELSKYSKIYNETKNLLEVTQETLQDATKQVRHSKDEELFWKNRVTSLKQEILQLKNVEENLRKWSSNLKEVSAKTVGMNKRNTKQLSKAQQTIAEMGDTITELVKDVTYTRELNSTLEYEVSRPRYASMGAIAKNEGFVMPMGKENIRTKFLGNSSPKLLKFKEKRNDN